MLTKSSVVFSASPGLDRSSACDVIGRAVIRCDVIGGPPRCGLINQQAVIGALYALVSMGGREVQRTVCRGRVGLGQPLLMEGEEEGEEGGGGGGD